MTTFRRFSTISSGPPAIDFQTNISFLEESPGWRWLAKLKPASVSTSDYKWFYLFWAALFMVCSISHTPWLKYFFETRFNQYLGRISFSFYLVHGPILWMLADRLYLAAGMSREGPLGLQFAFLAPHLIIFPVTLWVAEICTRLFDRPSILFSQWAHRKALG
jgi:peptidoglycan/LPS O-acetylase OafA/YrhL